MKFVSSDEGDAGSSERDIFASQPEHPKSAEQQKTVRQAEGNSHFAGQMTHW